MPQPIKRVAMVAHDAGSARALFPVAQELDRRGISSLLIVAGPAEKIWREEAPNLSALTVTDDISVEMLTRHLVTSRVEALLSGSGGYNRVEHSARLAARRLGLPVTALFDSWLHYAERFEREEDGVVTESRPDRVCAIDQWTREGAIAVGFDPACVFVTGHPDLEKTVRDCGGGSGNLRRQLRRAAGVSEEGLLIVFFSDPFYVGPELEFYSGPGALMHPDGRPIYGYTVREILPAVVQELDAAMLAENTSCDLIVRPHPLEHDDVLRSILNGLHPERVRTHLRADSSVIEWIKCADALLGMMTIALLHAALAGKPSISVEIGLHDSGQEDPCVANSLGYTRGVFDREALRSVCRLLARGDWQALKTAAPRYPLILEGAAARVADLLLNHAARPPSARAC